MKSIRVVLWLFSGLFLALSGSSLAQPWELAGTLEAFDIPSDDGTAIGLSWPVQPWDGPDREYRVDWGPSAEGPFARLMQFPSDTHLKSDAPKYFGFSDALKKEHFVEIAVKTPSIVEVQIDIEDPIKGKRDHHYCYQLAITNGVIEIPFPEAVSGPDSASDVLKPGEENLRVNLRWEAVGGEWDGWEYVVYQASKREGPYREVARFPFDAYREDSEHAVDVDVGLAIQPEQEIDVSSRVSPGEQVQLYYRVTLMEGEKAVAFPQVVTAWARPNWIAWNKLNNFILMFFLCGFVLFFIQWAKRNPNLFIRKIAGLDALDEAVGRATEMGKPIMYTTGYHDMDRVSTIASVNILEHVAKKVAQYDTRMIVPCKWSIAMTVCQEVVKEAYTNAGRPDAYNAHDIFFVAGEQFSWTAAVDGIIMRERPAANFLLGTFAAEALILAETGAATGAIQISGTDSPYQIPFFVVACDYCLIGEELYAASAYLSREPRLLGSLKGQDIGKLLLMAGLVVGNITLLLFELGLKTPILLWVKHFFTQI